MDGLLDRWTDLNQQLAILLETFLPISDVLQMCFLCLGSEAEEGHSSASSSSLSSWKPC